MRAKTFLGMAAFSSRAYVTSRLVALGARRGGLAGGHGSWTPEVADPDGLDAVLQFCADVPPGNARAKECLEDSREQPGFSTTCKTEVESMMESRASDFRLDPKLRQLCADDIQVTRPFPSCCTACCSRVLGSQRWHHRIVLPFLWTGLQKCCKSCVKQHMFARHCRVPGQYMTVLQSCYLDGCRMCVAMRGTPWTQWWATTLA